jgi:SPP1 gp7 family putative phage head morphogenesis protein
MKQTGMADKEIKTMLMNDLTGGGRLFGNYRNQIKNTVKTGVGISASNSSRQQFESAGITEYRWVAIGDKSVCTDCERRSGEVETMDFWKTVGLPQSGFSICRYNCRCQLIPEKYKDEDLDKPLLKKDFQKQKLVDDKEVNDILNKLDDPKEALRVFKSMNEQIERGIFSPNFIIDYGVDELGLKPVQAAKVVNHIKTIPQDLSKYLNKEPRFLDSFANDMHEWTRAVNAEARDLAVETFWDNDELRDYLQAELVDNLRNEGLNVRSLESFRKTKYKLYRSGTIVDGNNSFLMDKEAAIRYNQRFGVDSVYEIEVMGENIVPTQSGASELVVSSEDIISEIILDI